MCIRDRILLNPCGCEAGRHKLKNGLKTQKMHFLPVFELTSASLTAIWIEPNQCPSHQSILLTNPWNFGGNCSAFGEVEKLSFFESAILIFFSKKNIYFFASFPWKLVTNYVLEWMGLNFYHYDGLQPEMSPGIINEHEWPQVRKIHPSYLRPPRSLRTGISNSIFKPAGFGF